MSSSSASGRKPTSAPGARREREAFELGGGTRGAWPRGGRVWKTLPGTTVSGRSLRRRLTAFTLVLGTLLSLNNLLPYGGMRDDSCQTMFSSLDWWEGGNNHLYMPQVMLSDAWGSWTDVEVQLDPPVDGYGRVRDLEQWLNQEKRALNKEAVRTVVSQICARGHRVAMTYRPSVHGSQSRSVDNACDVPELSQRRWWIPVRRYETDFTPMEYRR